MGNIRQQKVAFFTSNIFAVWDVITFTLNQQMAPQYIPIWAVAVDRGDFKVIIEWN